MRVGFPAGSILISLLYPFISNAAEEGREAVEKSLQSPLGGMALMETMGGLILILLLIFGLGWLLRRFGRLPTRGNGMISIIGGVSLGTRERAVLLQVEDTRILVGVAPGRVQTLHLLENRPARPARAYEDDDFTIKMDPEIVDS